MRIALLGPGQPFRGGIAQHTDLLVTALSRSHDVTHLGFQRQYPRWLFGGRSDQDPSLPARGGRSERILDPLNPISWWRTAKRLATLAPDLVILPWWVPYWAPSFSATLSAYRRLAGASAAPVLFICHNVLPHDEPGLVIRLLVRHALRRADGWMLHGSSDEEALRRLLGRDLARREAGGNQRVFRGFLPLFDLGVVMEREDARALLGLPPDVPVALFFGFVRPYKGLQLLLAAWPRVLRSLPDSRLLIVGEFWEPVDAFWNRVRGLGIADSVVLVDRYVADEELGGYFGAADVVAMPYLSATGSAVAPLALRFGRPMVATAVGGIPDAVEHGLSGLLVPPDDAPALADALTSVLGDSALRDRLTAGAELERGRFRWEELVSRIEAAAACLRAAE